MHAVRVRFLAARRGGFAFDIISPGGHGKDISRHVLRAFSALRGFI